MSFAVYDPEVPNVLSHMMLSPESAAPAMAIKTQDNNAIIAIRITFLSNRELFECPIIIYLLIISIKRILLAYR